MQTRTTTTPSQRVSGGIRRWTIAAGAAALIQGSWSFFWPERFYSDFPTPGADWVSTLGHFNEHLTRDFGAAAVGLGVIAVIAGTTASRDAVRAVMAGFVVFGVLHLGYHLGTFGEFSTASATLQAAALVTFIAIPATVLVVISKKGKKL